MLETNIECNEKLLILWTTGDREAALKMVFMYAKNSRHFDWWKEVTLLIWGPSAKLLAGDEELKSYLNEMKEIGVEIMACKACADSYGVSATLQKSGVEVKYMGEGLTDMLKNGCKLLSV